SFDLPRRLTRRDRVVMTGSRAHPSATRSRVSHHTSRICVTRIRNLWINIEDYYRRLGMYLATLAIAKVSRATHEPWGESSRMNPEEAMRVPRSGANSSRDCSWDIAGDPVYASRRDADDDAWRSQCLHRFRRSPARPPSRRSAWPRMAGTAATPSGC